MTDADYANDLGILININVPGWSLLQSQEQAVGSIDFNENVKKTEYMAFKQKRAISTLSGKPLNLVDKFTYHESHMSPTESYAKIHLTEARNFTVMLLIMWKSYLSDKIKRNCFQAVALSIVLYRCTILIQTKHIEKKLDGNYIKMLLTVLNKTWN